MNKLLKISIIFSLLFLSLPSFSQNYAVKKGVVLKDKKEIATVEGIIGGNERGDLSFYQNGQTVFTVKGYRFKSGYPEHTSVYFFHLDFPQLGLSAIKRTLAPLNNEKQIIKNLLSENGVEFYEGGFKKEEVETLVAKNDAEEVKQDTLQQLADIEFYQTSLSGNHTLISDPKAEIAIVPIKNEDRHEFLDANYYVTAKPKGGNPYVIGLCKITKNTMTTVTGASSTIEEIVTMYSKLANPVQYDGVSFKYVIATSMDMATGHKKVFSYEKGVEIDPPLFLSSENMTIRIEKLAKLLISQNLL